MSENAEREKIELSKDSQEGANLFTANLQGADLSGGEFSRSQFD